MHLTPKCEQKTRLIVEKNTVLAKRNAKIRDLQQKLCHTKKDGDGGGGGGSVGRPQSRKDGDPVVVAPNTEGVQIQRPD